MYLVPQDDFPLHQSPLPLSRAAISDVHFNDGYWFSTYSDGVYLTTGMRLHPNMNVIDGFASVSTNEEQRSARFSRPLRPRHETEVGPLRIEIDRPMESIRLLLDGGPSDVRFDLRFEAVAEPFTETPSQHVKHGHLINDVVRYIQVCRTTGTLEFDGRTHQVDRWHAMRDHSWGIRASMGPRTKHGGVTADDLDQDLRRFRIWVPFEVEGHAGFFHTHEDATGATLDFEGRLDFPDGKSVGLVSVEHKLDYHPGTTNVSGGQFALVDEGGIRREYILEPSGPPTDVQGLGYYRGWHDSESAGMYRGDELVAESDRYPQDPTAPPAGPPHVPAPHRVGPTEFPCHLTGPDGTRGMAHFEHYILGAYEPYGFA